MSLSKLITTMRENLNVLSLNDKLKEAKPPHKHSKTPSKVAKRPKSRAEEYQRMLEGKELKAQGIVSNYKGSINKRRKLRLWDLREHNCVYCKKELDFLAATVDHITPRSKGGTNALDNLALACKPCNYKKADKVLPEELASPLVRPQVDSIGITSTPESHSEELLNIINIDETDSPEKTKFLLDKQKKMFKYIESLVSLDLKGDTVWNKHQVNVTKILASRMRDEAEAWEVGRRIYSSVNKKESKHAE